MSLRGRKRKVIGLTVALYIFTLFLRILWYYIFSTSILEFMTSATLSTLIFTCFFLVFLFCIFINLYIIVGYLESVFQFEKIGYYKLVLELGFMDLSMHSCLSELKPRFKVLKKIIKSNYEKMGYEHGFNPSICYCLIVALRLRTLIYNLTWFKGGKNKINVWWVVKMEFHGGEPQSLVMWFYILKS